MCEYVLSQKVMDLHCNLQKSFLFVCLFVGREYAVNIHIRNHTMLQLISWLKYSCTSGYMFVTIIYLRSGMNWLDFAGQGQNSGHCDPTSVLLLMNTLFQQEIQEDLAQMSAWT